MRPPAPMELLKKHEAAARRTVHRFLGGLSEPERARTSEIGVEKASGAKCERCWNWSDSVGKSADHPDVLCPVRGRRPGESADEEELPSISASIGRPGRARPVDQSPRGRDGRPLPERPRDPRLLQYHPYPELGGDLRLLLEFGKPSRLHRPDGRPSFLALGFVVYYFIKTPSGAKLDQDRAVPDPRRSAGQSLRPPVPGLCHRLPGFLHRAGAFPLLQRRGFLHHGRGGPAHHHLPFRRKPACSPSS